MLKLAKVLITAFLGLVALNSSAQPRAVDLGLSVKWASCNLGASTPEDYGSFYAWGETAPKQKYTWKNYLFRKSGDWSRNVKLTKYVTNPEKGSVDGRSRLTASDDAARAELGGRWRMPTYDEMWELVKKCTWTQTTKNGVDGFTIYGPNGNSIFLPLTGFFSDDKLIGRRERACFWTSSLRDWDNAAAACLIYYLNGSTQIDMERNVGFPIRAVQD